MLCTNYCEEDKKDWDKYNTEEEIKKRKKAKEWKKKEKESRQTKNCVKKYQKIKQNGVDLMKMEL